MRTRLNAHLPAAHTGAGEALFSARADTQPRACARGLHYKQRHASNRRQPAHRVRTTSRRKRRRPFWGFAVRDITRYTFASNGAHFLRSVFFRSGSVASTSGCSLTERHRKERHIRSPPAADGYVRVFDNRNHFAAAGRHFNLIPRRKIARFHPAGE